MLEQLLSKLPFILTIWTSILLCWGTFLNVRMVKSLKTPTSQTLCQLRTYHLTCNSAGIVVMMLYLMFEPALASNVGDAIIVINVFYTFFLTFASSLISESFQTKP